jgi:hypothetical protein
MRAAGGAPRLGQQLEHLERQLEQRRRVRVERGLAAAARSAAIEHAAEAELLEGQLTRCAAAGCTALVLRVAHALSS